MKVKVIFRQIHLWIGLILGSLFFVIALTGAISVWAPEMSAIIYHQKVEPKQEPFVSVSTLKATIDREFPEGDFRTAFFRDKSKTCEVLIYAPGTYYIAQLNPYTGELVHLQDMKKGWLNHLRALHRNLMLGDIGRQIVHWGTLLFFVVIISGIILWWPRNRAQRKKRLLIKWKSSPVKLNKSLHKVLGFYASLILIFSILTGLFWGFEFVRNFLKTVTGESKLVYELPESDENGSIESYDQFILLDSLALVFQKRYPSRYIRISNPHKMTDPIRVVVIDPGMLVYNTDHFYFDRYSGEQLHGHFEHGLHTEASLFHTLHGLVYDIHFGNILALPGRLFMFFASLIAASLPITGFVIWLVKRKKPKS
jgi:uncharacterized iron-regulated membrane protein